MRLLIKQRVFSWTDSYDVYDEEGNPKYFVKAELLTLLPAFEIEVGGMIKGGIQKQFTLFRPKYEIDYNGWRVEGDFLGWDYDVYNGCSSIIHISKQLLSWGDTYAIDINDPADELDGLMLVIAIDAANCTQGAS